MNPKIISWAQAAQARWQVPASLNLSAAILESDLGKATPPDSNNWHGIKSAGGTVTSTKEQTAGGVWYTIKAGFHVFATPADSFMYYGWLIANYPPYHRAMQMFLASRRLPADVQDLTSAVGHVYATALAYGTDLVLIQRQQKLYQYDTLPVPAPASPPVVSGEAPLKDTSMFSFSSLFALLAQAPTVISAVESGITDLETLIQQPAVKDLEALIQGLFTHVTTPGAAAIIEPKSATPGVAAKP